MALYETSGRADGDFIGVVGTADISNDGDQLARLSEDPGISRRRQVAPEAQVPRPAGVGEKIPRLAEVDLHSSNPSASIVVYQRRWPAHRERSVHSTRPSCQRAVHPVHAGSRTTCPPTICALVHAHTT
jgi:hypothetical protein